MLILTKITNVQPSYSNQADNKSGEHIQQFRKYNFHEKPIITQ